MNFIVLLIDSILFYLFYNLLLKKEYDLKTHIVFSSLYFGSYLSIIKNYSFLPIGISTYLELIIPIITYSVLIFAVYKENVFKSLMYGGLGLFIRMGILAVLARILRLASSELLLMMLFETIIFAVVLMSNEELRIRIVDYLKNHEKINKELYIKLKQAFEEMKLKFKNN